jgi:segregation and condensation protein B
LARGTLDRLLEAGWVQPKGRRESPGRPLNWVTTPHFLAHFGLDSLKELPGVEELRQAGLLDIGPAVLGDGFAPSEDEAEPNDE